MYYEKQFTRQHAFEEEVEAIRADGDHDYLNDATGALMIEEAIMNTPDAFFERVSVAMASGDNAGIGRIVSRASEECWEGLIHEQAEKNLE